MQPDQRHRQLLNLVETHKQMKVNDLSERLDVSKETIRRDLTVLENQGLLRKVHGSAVYIQTAVETAFSKRQTTQHKEKQIIASLAAAELHEGDSIMIQAGTTTDILAVELAKRSGFTIITHSITVANLIYHGAGHNEIFLLGGKYHGKTTYTLGQVVTQQIGTYMADYAVITIGALNAEKGIMSHEHEEANIGTAMMRQAREIIVLADHSKIGRNALVPICQFNAIDILVTDQMPDPNTVEALQNANVKLLVPEE